MSAPTTVRTEPAAGAARGAAWLAIAAVVLGLVIAPPGLGRVSFDGVGRVLAGDVEALRAGTWTRLPVGADVLGDEQLRTATEPAQLRVRGGVLALAPGTRVAVGRDTTELRDGAVLFEGDAVRAVRFGAVEVRGRGAFRVDARPSTRVGVYHGGVAVADGAGQRSVAPLQQVDLTEGRAAEVVALSYVADDPWDARLLSAAIAIDRQLDRTQASLRAVYGTQLQSPEFYRDFIEVDDVLAAALPELSPLTRGGTFGPPAETLVAVIAARMLVERAGMDVGQAIAEIAEQRRNGATWGLVLRRHDLRADDVRAAADTALRSRAIAVQEGSASPVDDAPAPDAGDGPPGGGDSAPEPPLPDDGTDPGDDGSDPGDGDGDGGDDGGGDGGGDDGGGDDPDPVDEIEDTVDDVVDELPLPADPDPPGRDGLPGPAEEARDRLSGADRGTGSAPGQGNEELPLPDWPRESAPTS